MDIQEHLKSIKTGNNNRLYEFLGCHLDELDGKPGAYFRVFAPHAKEIFVVGDFNNFDKLANPLSRLENSDVWQTFVENANEMQRYKFVIVDKYDNEIVKTDPFAFYSQNLESDRDFASYIYNIDGYKWHDEQYLKLNKTKDHLKSPINIYEVCLLSWKKHNNGNFLTFREYAASLVNHCKKLGYTHIELLPITEFELDCSWGYEVTNYFAVTNRFGRPKDLMFFIDRCHRAGIGVILDWVPGHFDSAETNGEQRKKLLTDNDFGLTEWDGDCLYESPKWDRKRQLAWGTRIFDYEDPYVVEFLISSAMFFLRKFHLDGLRIDAVSSIIYLDFCRNPDEWIPNKNGNNINYAGVEFLKKLNAMVFEEFPHALMIAEEVTGYPLVTRPTNIGGLGFNFKWNIGWMNDIWEYTSMDPYFRKYHHNIITHSIEYCFDENYILPVDHDEVGNGRHSLINKMNGDFATKISLCRAFFVYMYMHPGKKLTFMGSEFGQMNEWRYDKPLDFILLKADKNKKLMNFIGELNRFYKNSPELYELDYDKNSYVWLVRDDNKNCVNAFKRYDSNGNYLICVCNFSPYLIDDYVLGVDEPGAYIEVFSSDNAEFGGSGNLNDIMYSSIMNKNGKTNAIRLTLPANTSIILKKIDK